MNAQKSLVAAEEKRSCLEQTIPSRTSASVEHDLPVPILYIGEDGRVVWANPAAQDLLRSGGRELGGLSFADLVDPQFRDMAVAAFALCRDGADITPPATFEVPLEKSTRYIQCTLQPRSQGAVRAVLSDRTEAVECARRLDAEREEFRERNDALVLALEAAKEASALKMRFVANISHEIRTPMNGVIGLTELILGTELDEDQRHMAGKVLQSANDLLTIINDVLDFSKMEEGKLSLRRECFTPIEVIEGTFDLLRPVAERKGVKLLLAPCGSLPAQLVGDPVRLRQVLINLVGNALKFTDQGEVCVSVSVARSNPSGAELRFEVSDTGIGIPPEVQPLLFQPFMQADSAMTRRHAGTGLGLVICKQIVELMGGSISLMSAPGQGSVFWFTAVFGAAAGQTAPVADSIQSMAASKSLVSLEVAVRGGLILLAEDNAVNAMLATRVLRKAGFEVEHVTDGAKAVAVCETKPYATILMDCHMPVLDGLSATERIRSIDGPNTHTPIIALTASAMDEDRNKCMAAGMDGYLSKPFSTKQLVETASYWVTQSRVRAEVLPQRATV